MNHALTLDSHVANADDDAQSDPGCRAQEAVLDGDGVSLPFLRHPYPPFLALIRAFSPQQHYCRAYAYCIEPQTPNKGFLSIDGEAFPLAPYELEVHKGLGCFLSLYGRYNVEFDVPPPAGANSKSAGAGKGK